MTQTYWDKIIFSDESKFVVLLEKYLNKVLRLSSESFNSKCIRRSMKFPASVMIWSCITNVGIKNLHFIDRIVNTTKYIDILDKNLRRL